MKRLLDRRDLIDPFQSLPKIEGTAADQRAGSTNDAVGRRHHIDPFQRSPSGEDPTPNQNTFAAEKSFDDTEVRRELSESFQKLPKEVGTASREGTVRSLSSPDWTLGQLDLLLLRLGSLRSRIVRFIGNGPYLIIRLAMLGLLLAGLILSHNEPAALVAIAAVTLVGLVEILVISRTRTISVRTVALATILGATVVSLSATFIVLGLAGSTGSTSERAIMVVFTPLVEEILKLVPVFVVLAASARRMSLTVIDVGLLGYATGLGFEVAEEVHRSLRTGILGTDADDYWELLTSIPATPGIINDFSHPVATAVVAISAGLFWRSRRRGEIGGAFAALTALSLLYVVALHGHINSGFVVGWFYGSVGVRGWLPYIALLLVALALTVDLRDLRRAVDQRSFLSLVLPIPQRSGETDFPRAGLVTDIRTMRTRRLRAVHESSASVGSVDPWTYSALSAAPLILLLLAIVGRYSHELSSITVCTACVWDPTTGGILAGGGSIVGCAWACPVAPAPPDTSKWDDTDGDGIIDRKTEHDALGNRIRETDYDPEGNPIRVRDFNEDGSYVEYEDTDGDGVADRRKEVDADGNVISDHSINEDGSSVRYEDADGAGEKYDTVIEYDDDGEVERVGRDRNGDGTVDQWTEYHSDGSWTTIEDTDGDGVADRQTNYDPDGNITRQYTRHSDGSITLQVDYDGDGLTDVETEYGPDGNLRRKVTYDVEARTETEEAYDTSGNVTYSRTRIVAEDGTSVEYEDFDGDGRVDRVTRYDSEGNVTDEEDRDH